MKTKETCQLLTNVDFELLEVLLVTCEAAHMVSENSREALETIDALLSAAIAIVKSLIREKEARGETSEVEHGKRLLEEIIELYRIYYIEA